MKIAVYVDSFGNAADIFSAGHIAVFKKHAGCWHKSQLQTFYVNEDMSLDEIRKNAFDLAKQLNDCRILVLKSVPGVLQAFFESCNFKLWKMNGAPDASFSFIERFHLEEQGGNNEIYELFTKKKTGIYTVDMNQILTDNKAFTSRSLLTPFIKNHPFSKLNVICRHIPRWFEKELPSLGFSWTADKLESGLIRVIVVKVTKNNCTK